MSTPGAPPPPYDTADAPTDQQEQEWDWLFDFIQSFLRSPTWTTPLNNFIDENCGQFSAEDENKLSYTTIHKKFVDLVESLLSKNLKEIGISDEQFVAAVASGASSNDAINRIVFGQILAVDDFLTFKKMMMQRNAELEVESMNTLSTYSPSDEEEAQLQLELAIALSQSDAAPAARPENFNDDEIAAALRLSMLDVEKLQSEFEREQAELEHVIAMSLAAEAERLRLRELMEQMEREAAEAEAAKNKQPAAPQTVAAPKASLPPQSVAAPPIVHGKPLPPMSIKAPQTLVDPTSNLATAAAKMSIGSSSSSSSSSSSNSASASSSSKSSLPPISGSSSSGSKLGGLPPLTLGKLGMGASFDIPLAEAQKQHEANVKAAEIEFKKNRALLKESKEKAASALSEEELARRKEFLLKQRELLLKKKKEQRQSDLEKFEADQAALEADAAASSSKPADEMDEIERRRQAMKGALVEHLKNVHNEVETRRLASVDAEQSRSLQTQLKDMEALRRHKEANLDKEERERKKQDLERKQTMQRFAESMAQNQLDG